MNVEIKFWIIFYENKKLTKEQKDMEEMSKQYENEKNKIIEDQFNMRKEMWEEKR